MGTEHRVACPSCEAPLTVLVEGDEIAVGLTADNPGETGTPEEEKGEGGADEVGTPPMFP